LRWALLILFTFLLLLLSNGLQKEKYVSFEEKEVAFEIVSAQHFYDCSQQNS